MSLLSKLTFSEKSPRETLSPVARKRKKLLEQLEIQIAAANHLVKGEEYLRTVRRWQRIEGSNEKTLVTKQLPVRPWWWKDEAGKLMLSLRQGNLVMELADGKASIEVSDVSNLVATLETLREAISAGELDEQLKKSPYVKSIVGGRAKTVK